MAKPPGKKRAPAARQKSAPKASNSKAKAPSKAAKAPIRPAKARRDKRGTPKGKGTIRANGGQIGNPPHVPTAENRKLVETHAAVGTPHWAIAAEFKPAISEDTLERHYRKELDLGLIRMNARIGSSVAKKALDGDGDMQKFWLARRGGGAWANKSQTELRTPPGRPIETRDMTGLSDAQLAALAALGDAGGE